MRSTGLLEIKISRDWLVKKDCNNNEKTFNRVHIDEFKELQKKLDLFYKKHEDNLKEKNELLAVLYSMDEAVVAIDLVDVHPSAQHQQLKIAESWINLQRI